MPVTDISYLTTESFKDVSGIGDLIIQDVGISHTYIPISEIIGYDFIILKK